jgi:hypothetical protein
MKAVVVEIKDNFVAALTDDGCIIRMRNHHYIIGQVIQVEKKVSKIRKIPKAAVAACIVMVLGLLGLGAYAYATPTTYVSLDVNPSIEYSLNMFDRVLSVKAVNDDGTEILKQVNLENMSNKTIDEAIKLTIKEISEEGYFDGEAEGGIVITTSAKDLKRAAELAEHLKESADEELSENDKEADVEAQAVGKERVERARALGVTPGKLNLVEKLQKSADNPEEYDTVTWLNKPVKEIMKEIKKNRKEDRPVDTNEPEDTDTPDETTEPDQTSEPEDTDKPEVTSKPEKAGKPEKTNKPEKADKPEKTNKPEKTSKPEKTNKPEKTKKPEKTGKPNSPANPND